MVRNSAMRELKLRIEHALAKCEGMDSVRTHLIRAMNELESKAAKAESRRLEQSKLATNLPNLSGMNRKDAENAIRRIEDMISDETRKKPESGSRGLISE